MKSPKDDDYQRMALHTQTRDMQTADHLQLVSIFIPILKYGKVDVAVELLNILAPNNLLSADLNHRRE